MTITTLYSRNFFDVGSELQALNVSGVPKTGSAYLRYAVSRSRQRNLYAQAGISRKQALTKVDRAVVARDDLSMIEGSLTFDLIDPDTRSINIGSVGVSFGLEDWLGGMGNQETVATRQLSPTRTTGSGKFADNTFKKFVASFSRIQTIYDGLSAILRMEGTNTLDLSSYTTAVDVVLTATDTVGFAGTEGGAIIGGAVANINRLVGSGASDHKLTSNVGGAATWVGTP